MPSNASNSESIIQKLEDDLIAAMRLPNLTFLENIFSEKYIFLGSDGSTWGKGEALEDFKSPNYELSKIEIKKSQITMHGNCAIVTGCRIVEGIVGEESISGRYLFMRVWRKGENGWKIIAVHTSEAK